MTTEAAPQGTNPTEFTINLDTDDDLIERSSKIPFNADQVHTYLNKIGKTPLLNAEQEVELAKRIEAGLFAGYLLLKAEETQDEPKQGSDAQYLRDLATLAEDGKAAKDHMMEANLRLVVSLAKRYTNKGMPFMDVIQEGNLGLNRAVEKFDYTKGYKFSTYATWWIRQAITRALADKGRIIRVPVHMNEKLVQFARTEKSMLQDLGRKPTHSELAAEMGVSEEDLLGIIKYIRQEPISINAPIGETGGNGNSDTEFGDMIPDKLSESVHDTVQKVLLAEAIEGVLRTFTEKEADVIRMRFGLVDGEPRKLDYIGKKYGVTRERIRQIEMKAMKGLRSNWSKDQLRGFLDNS
jgi:RNA polymerase primary sigma factor